jgi:hypothetical protein
VEHDKSTNKVYKNIPKVEKNPTSQTPLVPSFSDKEYSAYISTPTITTMTADNEVFVHAVHFEWKNSESHIDLFEMKV